MSLVMYDSIVVDTVPPNPPAVAGYIGGQWQSYRGLVAKFPHAYSLDIAVNRGERARCFDIEPGNAVPSDAPDWLRNLALRDHGKPVLYTSASMVGDVLNACNNAGIGRDHYLIWSAHYGREHICAPHVCGYPSAEGTQWTSTALGRNLDQSLIDGQAFFGPPPPPPDPHHYAWYARSEMTLHGKRLHELDIVEQYDALRPHATLHVFRLHQLRQYCHMLADEIARRALATKPHSWELYNRGFRYQQLIHRAQGKRVA